MSTRLVDPPASLLTLRAGDARTIPAGTTLCRIYNRFGDHATRPDQLRSWGPVATARFDHHDPAPSDHVSSDRVTAATGSYAIEPSSPVASRRRPIAMDSPIVTAVAEAFQNDRIVAISARQGLAILSIAHDIEVLDLSSGWATRAGAGNHLSTGPHSTTRRWARALHSSYPHLAGMTWVSSVHPSGRALVLNERAADRRGVVACRLSFDRPLDHPMTGRLMAEARRMIGYGLA